MNQKGKSKTTTKLYSVTEYAALTNVSRQAVLYLVNNQKALPEGISAQKVGKTWVIIAPRPL